MKRDNAKYYLFGAGINCAAVIKFFGKSNIKAIIDSDERLQGEVFDGIPIISLVQYKEENQQETIIISSSYFSEDIIKLLERNGIKDFYVSPYMQIGFYENGLDIAKKLNLFQYPGITFVSEHPMAKNIIIEMRNRGYNGEFYFIDTDKFVAKETVLVITNKIEKNQYIDKKKEYLNLIDITDIYKKKFSYKNPMLEKFKKKHEGKRCFVIGNGPSLTYSDLQKLHDEKEICFGVNRIYLAYQYTDWRPDYYVACDYFILKKDAKIIQEMCVDKFIRYQFKEIDFDKKENLYEYGVLEPDEKKLPFSDDIVEGTYTGRTVVYDAIQIAAYMGFSEIYLLGVDMTKNMIAEAEGSHFYKSPDVNEKLLRGDRDSNIQAMCNARRYMELQGRIFKNATRNVQWDEVEKINFDSLF